MAFTDVLDVDVGDATKASDYDTLADNPEWLRDKADVDHDFDISTGTGYHNASYDAALHMVNVDSGNESAGTLWLDQDGELRLKVATSTTTPPTPSSETDGYKALLDSGATQIDGTLASGALTVTGAATVSGNLTAGSATAAEKSLDVFEAGIGYDHIQLTNTAATNYRRHGIVAEHGTDSEEAMMLINSFSKNDDSDNTIRIGGGVPAFNAATNILFLTAANGNTTNGTERMRINSSGDVGIGTASPSEHLEIYGGSAGDAAIQLNESGNYQSQIVLRGNDTEFRGSSGKIEFYTGNADGASSTERMTIDSTGNVHLSINNKYLTGKLTGGDTRNLIGWDDGNAVKISDLDMGTLRQEYASASSAAGARVMWRKSRGTSGSQTIVADGDDIVTLEGYGYNGSGYDPVAYIKFEVDGTPGSSSDMPGRLTFLTTPNATADVVERMRIDSAGNVGINEASPAASTNTTRLHISNTTAVGALRIDGQTASALEMVDEAASSSFRFYFDDDVMYMQMGSTADPTTSNANSMRIDAASNVGLNVAPEAWDSGYKAIHINTLASISAGSNNIVLSTNAYYGGGAAWSHMNTGVAAALYLDGGVFAVRNAPSASADADVAWLTRFLIDTNGQQTHETGHTTGYLQTLNNTYSSAGPSFINMYFTASAPDNNSNLFITAADTGGQKFVVYSDGDVANHDGTYGTISDQKYKRDIVDARSYWDDFKSLRYKKWKDKVDVETKGSDAQYRLGLVAQDVESVFPALVPESPEDEVHEVDVPAVLNDDGEEIEPATKKMERRQSETETFKWVKSSIVEGPIMAKVVQELQTRVEALEAAE